MQVLSTAVFPRLSKHLLPKTQGNSMSNHEQIVKQASPKLIVQRSELNACQQKADNCKTLIAKQQHIIDESSLVDTASELKKQRRTLLAESATGIDHTKKLAEIDADIAKAEKSDHAANQAQSGTVAKARETLQGLQEMLPNINQAIHDKRKAIAIIQDDLLLKLVDAELEQYKTLAYGLMDSLNTILALDVLIGKNGIRRHSQTMPPDPQQLKIPALSDMKRAVYSGEAVHLTTDGTVGKEVVDALENRLQQQGFEV